jgi:transposase InsO family protein
VIYHQRKTYAIQAMCKFFGVSRAAYYAWIKRLDQPDPDAERKQLIQEAYEKSHKTYGYRRIGMWIRKYTEQSINHKAVLRIMKLLQIRSIARKRRMFKRMTELETYHRYDNLLNREFTASRPNQKWVTDITYVSTQQGWAYLSTIQDLFDGFIVAHELGTENSLNLVLNTLKQAKQKEQSLEGLLLHSDQGYQYTSPAYQVLTQAYAITPSMSRRANCWDNAVMENFFGHLKEEALRHVRNPSLAHLKQLIAEYVQFYNYERIQLKTRQTPYETRCLSS